jgi:4-carboxymuconolactone decarboxylase
VNVYTPGMSRIAPLEAPYSPEVAQMLEKWMPPDSGMEPLKLFRTLAVHGELAARMRPTGAAILGGTARLAPRDREIVLHRTCALNGAEYEWGVHVVVFGRPLGLSDEQLASTAGGSPEDSCWDERDALLLRAADELHATSTLSDELFPRLTEHWRDDQILELVIVAGWYRLISYVVNAAGVEPESWAARFPTRRRAP